MWRLTLARKKMGTYGDETHELSFKFKEFGALIDFAGNALEYSDGEIKAIIEQIEMGEK